MNLKTLFGKNLKKIRQSKGYTQQEFAELVNLQPHSIAQIETGRRGVSFDTLEKIASKLKTDYYDLFSFSNNELACNDELINKAVSIMNDMDKNSILFIISILESYSKHSKR